MVRVAGLWCGVVLVGAAAAGGGCNRDVRLAGRPVRDVTVGPVTLYGVTLDQEATPEQVAYVLLRLIRDDFLAKTKAERDHLVDQQLDIAAANVIRKANATGLQDPEFLFNVVSHWTPTVSHYVPDFETEWEKAKARFVKTQPHAAAEDDSAPTQCEVFMELADPGGDPDARVVMVIWMARDRGFWRVIYLGFDSRARSIEGLRAVARRRKARAEVGGE